MSPIITIMNSFFTRLCKVTDLIPPDAIFEQFLFYKIKVLRYNIVIRNLTRPISTCFPSRVPDSIVSEYAEI